MGVHAQRGLKLVLGGELKGVYEEADYLKLNTGLMLLRVRPADCLSDCLNE